MMMTVRNSKGTDFKAVPLPNKMVEMQMKVDIYKNGPHIETILLDGNGVLVEEVYRFMRFLSASGKSPNTIRSYTYDLKLYYTYLLGKGINAKDLSSCEEKGPIDILSDFILWLQYPKYSSGIINLVGEHCARKNRTVNRIMEAVLSFYRYVASNNMLQELDVYKMQRTGPKFKSFLYELVQHKTELQTSIFKKPVAKTTVSYTMRDQYKSMLSLCYQGRDRVLLELLFEGGLRIGEALGIHYSDLTNIEDGVIRIVPRENNENGARVKRNAGGIIYLPPYVIDDLIQYINETIVQYDSDYLFLTLRGKSAGQPMTANNVEQLFIRLSKQGGHKVTPHMCRHGFATEKLNAGWQMVDIQHYLRHSNIQSTQIYAEYSDMLKKEKMREFIDSRNMDMEQLYDITKRK